MKRACFILTLLLALHQAHSENEVASLPNEVQVRLRAGMNALAITRFPQTNPGEPLAEKLSLATVFGPENEAELQSGTANTADIIWIHQGQGSW